MERLEKEWKDGSLKLFPYQFEGVECMQKWLENGHGGINAMDMGLGKTCQTVVLLSRLFAKQKGPFLVLSPLSVCDHWADEIQRFSMNSLEPIKFTGYEAERQKMLQEDIEPNNVFITAPHIFIKESTVEYLKRQQKRLPFHTVVIDEAQCVKNQNTKLATCIREVIDQSMTKFILLTGTPIQNDLTDLYSLLSFSYPDKFPIDSVDFFLRKYRGQSNLETLKETLAKYMIRRTKAEVFSEELEKCEQVVLYHGITQIQKELYKNIISKNSDAFQDKNSVKLTNILMQLRKCVIHPYMFQGIEPEPFEEGEHLVEASGKLQVLDRLLKYCKSRSHRCLLFSQFIGALDIVEDFLRMRKWSYERLDGTCRAEERTERISKFQKSKEAPFCFLLSTKAGGVGLTLTGADTVVFLDSDWNPQNDIQAMARCHRIGQTKTVRVIRLVARYTVDQYVVAKARDKLKLTDEIMGTKDSQLQAADIISVLRNQFGLLMEADTDKFECSDKELEFVIGKTKGANWQLLEDNKKLLNPDECDDQDVDKADYCTFEGKSYRGKPEEWDKLMEESSVENKENKSKREYRKMKDDQIFPPKKRKRQTKQELWLKKGYESSNLMEPEKEEEEEENQEDSPLKYVFGDVTRPKKFVTGKDLILHCVDNGGEFGTGGVFNAIRLLDPEIAVSYEKAGKMKDLQMGDAHLYSVSGTSRDSSELKVVLLVAQNSKNRRAMRPDVLEKCLARVSYFAKQEGYTIHTPRLGKGCDISWYMVDRLLKKHFSLRGISCFVYYHTPNRRAQSLDEPESNQTDWSEESKENTPERKIKKPKTPTPSPSKTGRPKRRTIQLKSKLAELEDEDDEKDSSEESSDESSASENNWSDSASEEDESEEEDELDEEDEDPQDLSDNVDSPIMKRSVTFHIPKMKINPKLVVDMDDSEEEEMTSKETTGKKRKRGSSDLYQQMFGDWNNEESNREPIPFLKGHAIYLDGLDADEKEKQGEIVSKHGGEISNCPNCSIVIVPDLLLVNEEELEIFKGKFDTDSLFLREQFLPHASQTNSWDDLTSFIL